MKTISKINENIIPVKVGVIGIGNMGWHHARVLSLLKDADLVGVADLDEERGKLAIVCFQDEIGKCVEGFEVIKIQLIHVKAYAHFYIDKGNNQHHHI